MRVQMKTENKQQQESIVIMVDGQCRLCHRVTRFVLKRDRRKQFKFATLQSDYGRLSLAKAGLSTTELDTFVLQQGEQIYIQSSAALRVFRLLGGLWSLLYVFILIPRPLRDGVYNQIAKNRYRWFGKTEACLLPTAELRERFID